MKKTLFGLILALAATMLLSSCKKDNAELILGSWTNTAESCEITIAGLRELPAGIISMEFTSDSVLIYDDRVNCIPEWHHYTLAKQAGKLMLQVEEPFAYAPSGFEVEQLDKEQLVLVCPENDIDVGFRYVMHHTK